MTKIDELFYNSKNNSIKFKKYFEVYDEFLKILKIKI